MCEKLYFDVYDWLFQKRRHINDSKEKQWQTSEYTPAKIQTRQCYSKMMV